MQQTSVWNSVPNTVWVQAYHHKGVTWLLAINQLPCVYSVWLIHSNVEHIQEL